VNLTQRTAGEVLVVRLAGELDGRAAPAVQSRLAELCAAGRDVLLDLAGLTYLSSAGLRTLLLAHRWAQAAGRRLALAAVPDRPADVMAATGFLGFFELFDDTDAGIKALNGR
jgi:anti-anti-sigma factor